MRFLTIKGEMMTMEQAVFQFLLQGKPVSCEKYGMGHINRTFLVVTDTGRRYILQCLNRQAFHNIPKLMENVQAVTEFLRKQNDDPRSSLRLIPTVDGNFWYQDAAGEYWRVYDFIEDSVCLQAAETPDDFYQSALAFGSFQRMLGAFPAESLYETIPDFHNTPDRYRKFDASLNKDAAGRAGSVQEEIDFVLAHREEAGVLQTMRVNGSLPVRVTHNDTKLNNVMLDAVTRKALCVIDLDTIMPGLAAYDFGDSIRFGASSAAEDETDLEKVHMNLDLYKIYAEGFIPACGGLTEAEIDSLPWGAKIMTLECGLRFLTDYLDGDIYFSTAYPDHNLDRARNQFKLVEDMEAKWPEMQALVRRIGNGVEKTGKI